MARLILLLLSLRLAFAQPEALEIAEKLSRTIRLVLPGTTYTTIIRNEMMSTTSEAILGRFMQLSTDSVIITSDTSPFLYSVTFVNALNIESLRADQRRVIMASDDVFPAVYELRRFYDYLNAVYLVYNDSGSSVIYHYNRFQNRLSKWNELQEDPIDAATDDLAGLSFNNALSTIPEPSFMTTLTQKLNGSFTSYVGGGMTIALINSLTIPRYLKTRELLYLHRTDHFHVLVPRVNKPVPTVLILTDPFNLNIWLLNSVAITALAMLRTYLAKQCSVQRLVESVASLVGSITVGTTIKDFTREFERQLVGLVLLLYVVLFNCYQSQVISFLMSPRFYPELDTLQQLNESCCWKWVETFEAFHFRVVGECEETNQWSVLAGNKSEDKLLAHSLSLCIPVDTRLKGLVEMFNKQWKFGWILYRWSKCNLNEWPMMASITGDSAVADRVRELSGVYYGERALFRRFERGGEERRYGRLPKSFTLEDLSLGWYIYGVGMGLGLMAVFVERAIAKFLRSFEDIVMRICYQCR